MWASVARLFTISHPSSQSCTQSVSDPQKGKSLIVPHSLASARSLCLIFCRISHESLTEMFPGTSLLDVLILNLLSMAFQLLDSSILSTYYKIQEPFVVFVFISIAFVIVIFPFRYWPSHPLILLLF